MEDFEPMSPEAASSKHANRKNLHLSITPVPDLVLGAQDGILAHPQRSGSMATVRLKRRNKLAEKLKEIFELEDIQEVIAGTSSILAAYFGALTHIY